MLAENVRVYKGVAERVAIVCALRAASGVGESVIVAIVADVIVRAIVIVGHPCMQRHILEISYKLNLFKVI